MTIRLVIAEDQRMMLGALGVLLGLEDDLTVVGTALDGDEALRLVESLTPDVLLTDIEMPGLTGLDVAAEIRRRGLPTRVVILTTFARSGYLRRALDAGAAGYLLKDAPSATLAEAIRAVHAGRRAIDPELAADAWGDATRSPTASARSCAWPARGSPMPRSPHASTCRTGRFGTTCPRRSESSASRTAPPPRGSPATAGGSDRRQGAPVSGDNRAGGRAHDPRIAVGRGACSDFPIHLECRGLTCVHRTQ